MLEGVVCPGESQEQRRQRPSSECRCSSRRLLSLCPWSVQGICLSSWRWQSPLPCGTLPDSGRTTGLLASLGWDFCHHGVGRQDMQCWLFLSHSLAFKEVWGSRASCIKGNGRMRVCGLGRLVIWWDWEPHVPTCSTGLQQTG